ncbi:hypothetical protein GCM10009830_34270 [Glycomyces endophyticus]|uniref:Lipoprotein n=1 Tax=Glycomyces endophyticus TaxID=480996 RepID=A0ABP4T8N2_9ACTN
MRKFAALAPLSAMLLALGACQSGGADDQGAEATETPTVVESPTAVALDPALPATPVYTVPTGVTESPDLVFPYVLAYEHQGWSYTVTAEGVGAEANIYVTSYLLPEGTAYPDYQSQLTFVNEYDALVVNDADPTSHTPALINGREGFFRFSIIRDGGPTLYQRNFFIFDENHVVQVTCQWTEGRDIVGPLCGQLQQTLTLT